MDERVVIQITNVELLKDLRALLNKNGYEFKNRPDGLWNNVLSDSFIRNLNTLIFLNDEGRLTWSGEGNLSDYPNLVTDIEYLYTEDLTTYLDNLSKKIEDYESRL